MELFCPWRCSWVLLCCNDLRGRVSLTSSAGARDASLYPPTHRAAPTTSWPPRAQCHGWEMLHKFFNNFCSFDMLTNPREILPFNFLYLQPSHVLPNWNVPWGCCINPCHPTQDKRELSSATASSCHDRPWSLIGSVFHRSVPRAVSLCFPDAQPEGAFSNGTVTACSVLPFSAEPEWI